MPTNTTTVPSTARPHVSLMACGELRDALTAIEEGKTPAAVAALMAIDPESWHSIEERLTELVGESLRALLLAAVGTTADTERAAATQRTTFTETALCPVIS